MNSWGAKRLRPGLAVGLVALSALVLLWYIPLPGYMFYAPARAREVRSVIRIPGADRQSPAQFYLPQIYQHRANLPLLIWRYVRPGAQVVRADTSPEAVAANARALEEQSTRCLYLAQLAALKQLGTPVTVQTLGLRVTRVISSPGPAGKPGAWSQTLLAGDLIVALNGKPVKSPASFSDELQRAGAAFESSSPAPRTAPAGAQISATIKRGGVIKNLRINIYRSWVGTSFNRTQRFVAGAYLVPQVSQVSLPRPATFRARAQGGSGAGLMFGLEMVAALGSPNFPAGKRLAGVGSLDAEGNLGPVQDLQYAALSAQESGATVFIFPRRNLPEAGRLRTTMVLLPVDTLAEAVKALEGK